MIIQTGSRTDIPAFYSRWFLNRLEEGYVMVRNPYNPSAVTRYDLNPEVVDMILFCTKNPAPMLPHMDKLKDYGQFWFVTLTPYGKDIEPNMPDKRNIIKSFKELSDIVGPDAVTWRYDPILVDENYTVERHLTAFETIARELSGYTRECVISFVDLYKKVQRNYPELKAVTYKDRLKLGAHMKEIADHFGMNLKTCGEGDELAPYGADCSGCMTIETYERALGEKLNVPSFKPVRKECACFLGNDIGAYDTCGHLCRYCYANTNADLVKQNMQSHDPDSPFLLGGPMEGDKIHQAMQERWVSDQMMFIL